MIPLPPHRSKGCAVLGADGPGADGPFGSWDVADTDPELLDLLGPTSQGEESSAER